MDSTNTLEFRVSRTEEELKETELRLVELDKQIRVLTLWQGLIKYAVVVIGFCIPLSIPATGWIIKSYVHQVVIQELRTWQQHPSSP